MSRLKAVYLGTYEAMAAWVDATDPADGYTLENTRHVETKEHMYRYGAAEDFELIEGQDFASVHDAEHIRTFMTARSLRKCCSDKAVERANETQ